MISPDCCLIVTKGSALLIFAMKMVPKPSSGWQKWNVRPIGYYLELLPNFLPLALVETSQVSEVGVLEAAADMREGFRGIYFFVSSCFLAAQCACCTNSFTKWNHISPFALFHYRKVSAFAASHERAYLFWATKLSVCSGQPAAVFVHLFPKYLETQLSAPACSRPWLWGDQKLVSLRRWTWDTESRTSFCDSCILLHGIAHTHSLCPRRADLLSPIWIV